jgi:hypothetical protein
MILLLAIVGIEQPNSCFFEQEDSPQKSQKVQKTQKGFRLSCFVLFVFFVFFVVNPSHILVAALLRCASANLNPDERLHPE